MPRHNFHHPRFPAFQDLSRFNGTADILHKDGAGLVGILGGHDTIDDWFHTVRFSPDAAADHHVRHFEHFRFHDRAAYINHHHCAKFDNQPPEVADGHEFVVTLGDLETGLVLGKVKATDNVDVTEFRLGTDNPDGDNDGTPAFTIAPDGTLSVSDHDDVDFGEAGEIKLAVTAHDAASNFSEPGIVTISLASDPLIPAETPFNYNVGINYESWESGRTGYSITADLNQITQYFKLIKTYHAAAVGTADPTNPIIDQTQADVIGYVVATTDVELVMGTANSALAQFDTSTSTWAAGLMTDKAYTDKWVQMLVDTFGGAANVENHLKAILLGNEIDANGPAPTDPSFNDYLTWIQTSFDNLQASLSDAGLGTIPVSTTIANYGSSNVVSAQITQYIDDNWGTDWNDGTPFVLFNQYTQNGGQSPEFQPVEDFFERVQTEVPAGLEVFIGETGFSSFYGAQNQATVYQQIFDWLDDQQSNGGKTVPTFPFVAFDRPSFDTTPTPQETDFGIFGEDANSQPTGLKSDLDGILPSWTDAPINTLTLDNDVLLGGAGKDIFGVESGTGSIDGGDGDSDLLILYGERDGFVFKDPTYKLAWRCDQTEDDMLVTIRSKHGGTTDIEVQNVEYFQFDDQVVHFDDLPIAGRGHHVADDFVW